MVTEKVRSKYLELVNEINDINMRSEVIDRCIEMDNNCLIEEFDKIESIIGSTVRMLQEKKKINERIKMLNKTIEILKSGVEE